MDYSRPQFELLPIESGEIFLAQSSGGGELIPDEWDYELYLKTEKN